MSNLYRAQILLEPEQHQALVEIGQREGRSISDLARAAVREYLERHLEEKKRQHALEALESLARIRQEIAEKYGPLERDISEILEEMREERVNELDTALRGLE